jgi:hypothetical protein
MFDFSFLTLQDLSSTIIFPDIPITNDTNKMNNNDKYYNKLAQSETITELFYNINGFNENMNYAELIENLRQYYYQTADINYIHKHLMNNPEIINNTTNDNLITIINYINSDIGQQKLLKFYNTINNI